MLKTASFLLLSLFLSAPAVASDPKYITVISCTNTADKKEWVVFSKKKTDPGAGQIVPNEHDEGEERHSPFSVSPHRIAFNMNGDARDAIKYNFTDDCTLDEDSDEAIEYTCDRGWFESEIRVRIEPNGTARLTYFWWNVTRQTKNLTCDLK